MSAICRSSGRGAVGVFVKRRVVVVEQHTPRFVDVDVLLAVLLRLRLWPRDGDRFALRSLALSPPSPLSPSCICTSARRAPPLLLLRRIAGLSADAGRRTAVLMTSVCVGAASGLKPRITRRHCILFVREVNEAAVHV